MSHLEPKAFLSETLLQRAAALPFSRLARLRFQGRDYFVKMAEIHDNMRLRLFKGDPASALAREAAMLRSFAARGAAVARIIAADERRLILADHGTPVEKAIRSGDVSDALLRQIGSALADLHARGLAHGRPVLRDICHDGSAITFLDLEAGAKLDATDHDKARDLMVLIYSMMVTTSANRHMARQVIEGYRQAGTEAVWQKTRRRSRNLWWLELLALPGVWVHRRRGKRRSEMIAIGATRALIAAI